MTEIVRKKSRQLNFMKLTRNIYVDCNDLHKNREVDCTKYICKQSVFIAFIAFISYLALLYIQAAFFIFTKSN